MRQVATWTIALLAVIAVAGCGASNKVAYSRGVIQVGAGVNIRGLTKSVLGIRVGTTESKVRARLGKPYARVAQTCWDYHADQGGSSRTLSGPSALDGITFCMSLSHRVARIQLAGHL